jgi:hypothetical protein
MIIKGAFSDRKPASILPEKAAAFFMNALRRDFALEPIDMPQLH